MAVVRLSRACAGAPPDGDALVTGEVDATCAMVVEGGGGGAVVVEAVAGGIEDADDPEAASAEDMAADKAFDTRLLELVELRRV